MKTGEAFSIFPFFILVQDVITINEIAKSQEDPDMHSLIIR